MISIKKYNHKMKKIWDNFIDCSNNGTMFHKQSFLSYHQKRRFNNHSLLFYYRNNLIAALPGVLIKTNNNTIFRSHPGASFGGFVILKDISFQLIQQILSALETYLIKIGVNSILFISSPNVYFKKEDQSLNYLLSWNKYLTIERYISHYTNLTTSDITYKIIKKRKQRYIKKIIDKKIFTITESTCFDVFYKLLIQSKKKYNSLPTHSLEELNKLKSIFPQHIQLFVSMFNQDIVGGTVLFYLNSHSCLVFYNTVSDKHNDTQLSSYQLYNAIEAAKNRQCQIIDFGVSHMPEMENPLKPKFSLIRFKEQFGAKGCIRTVYKKDLDRG